MGNLGTPDDIEDISIIYGLVASNACGYIFTVHNQCLQKHLALHDLLDTDGETIKKLENIANDHCEFI